MAGLPFTFAYRPVPIVGQDFLVALPKVAVEYPSTIAFRDAAPQQAASDAQPAVEARVSSVKPTAAIDVQAPPTQHPAVGDGGVASGAEGTNLNILNVSTWYSEPSWAMAAPEPCASSGWLRASVSVEREGSAVLASRIGSVHILPPCAHAPRLRFLAWLTEDASEVEVVLL
jgi:hypothetical protein